MKVTKLFVMNESPSPTPTELAILRVLWERGHGTVRQLHNALKDERRTGYSTTLKMMQIMVEKGLLLKDESIRPQVFRAAIAKERTQVRLLDELIERAFGGSASNLVLRAAAAKRISSTELADIRKLIDRTKMEKR